MASLAERLREIASQYHIADLYAFGSRAAEIAARVRGQATSNQHPASDVDIGVRPLPGRQLSVHDKVRLAIALEDLLGVNRVDLVVLPEAPPFLAANIIRGERLLAANERAADEYLLYVLRRAGDLVPLRREQMALIQEGLA